jgi:hypothetical protein
MKIYVVVYLVHIFFLPETFDFNFQENRNWDLIWDCWHNWILTFLLVSSPFWKSFWMHSWETPRGHPTPSAPAWASVSSWQGRASGRWQVQTEANLLGWLYSNCKLFSCFFPFSSLLTAKPQEVRETPRLQHKRTKSKKVSSQDTDPEMWHTYGIQDCILYKNEYRIFRPVVITIRWLR